MSLSSSLLMACLLLLALSVRPAAAVFSFQAFNDSACTEPLSTRRFPIIDLPDIDFVWGRVDSDACAVQPSPNISAIIYICSSSFMYINVYTLPIPGMNSSYCPQSYAVSTPRTVFISSLSGSWGPVQPGGSCWHLSYLHTDHNSGLHRRAQIYGAITCGATPAGGQTKNAAAETQQAALPVAAAAATVGLLLAL